MGRANQRKRCRQRVVARGHKNDGGIDCEIDEKIERGGKKGWCEKGWTSWWSGTTFESSCNSQV